MDSWSTTPIYYDMLSFARQVGMLPSAGSRGDRAMTAAFNTLSGLRGKLHLSPRSRDLAQTRRIAAPYLQHIDAVLAGAMAPGKFAAEFERAWQSEPGPAPHIVYEPVSHHYGVAEADNPEFAATGDTDYTSERRSAPRWHWSGRHHQAPAGGDNYRSGPFDSGAAISVVTHRADTTSPRLNELSLRLRVRTDYRASRFAP